MEGDGDGWEPVAELVTLGAGAVGSNGAGCGIASRLRDSSYRGPRSTDSHIAGRPNQQCRAVVKRIKFSAR